MKQTKTYKIFENIQAVNISENDILEYDADVLHRLLIDHTLSEKLRRETGDSEAYEYIFWATNDYQERGKGYSYNDKITPERITGPENVNVIMPRILKSRQMQLDRTKDKAEVFTPSWVCNAQNNLIDEVWFGHKNVFNKEFVNEDGEHGWNPTEGKILFPDEKKCARRYVLDNVMEVTCGEAPYLVSRYDTTTGQLIPIEKRVGLLDRKLRIVNENVDNEKDWHEWARKAFQHTYGYEWQGDNLLLAREALLYTYIEYFMYRFNRRDAYGRYIPGEDGKLHVPTNLHIREACYWISWNIWQMDGLRYVVPDSCHEEVIPDLFGGETRKPCPGCAAGTDRNHNGVQCIIRDWSLTKRPKNWTDNAWQGKSPAPWQKKTFRSLFIDNSETEI